MATTPTPEEKDFNVVFRMFLMTESQIDLLVRYRLVIVIAGLAMMVLPLAFGVGFGVFSGFTLFSLGVYCQKFRHWRREPGLWMLAILLIVTLGPGWVCFETLHWQAVFRPGAKRAGGGVNWNRIRLSVDAGVALLIFAKTMKLLITVAIENWKRTRPFQTDSERVAIHE